MGLGRCMYLVLLFSPPGILYLILVSTMQGHFRNWRTWTVVTRCNMIWCKVIKKNCFFGKEFKETSQSRSTYMENRNLMVKPVQSSKGIVRSSQGSVKLQISRLESTYFKAVTVISYQNGLHKTVRFHHYFLKVKFHCK